MLTKTQQKAIEILSNIRLAILNNESSISIEKRRELHDKIHKSKQFAKTFIERF